jgi:RNA polymerase sigma factor (sigma-70 family)
MEEWVKAAKAGEETAWNVLYQRYYPGLYAIALRMCGNIPETNDLVQDSFITAFLKLSHLKDTRTFGGWIKTILVRNCYRLLHKNHLTKYQGNNFPESDSLWEHELEKKLDCLATQSRLYTVLTQLPETLRSTLLLRYFSSFQSYTEIASILSVPVGTVRSRLNEAKLKLAEKWHQPLNPCINILKESDEWNSFYYETFSGMHHHDNYKNRFINHLDKNLQLILATGKSNTGSWRFEKMIVEDRKFGSWLTPANVMSCGNISIIEAKHFNSPEHPHHCPPKSVALLYRKKGEVSKMSLYLSWQ